MWDHRYLRRIDWRLLPILLALMVISILVITATTGEAQNGEWESAFSQLAISQLRWFGLGFLVYFFFAGLDYKCLRRWAWLLYIAMLIMLCGLFFTAPIQNVQRWYRIPFVNFAFQPSEYAKLVVAIMLSCFFDANARIAYTARNALQGLLIVALPFLLILKQPDLGTSLILYPLTLVLFYLAGGNGYRSY